MGVKALSGGGGAIGTLNPATGALVGGGGAMGTLGALATNPFTIAGAGVGLGAAAWLKSQAHWEANEGVEQFENPFHYQFLAPLVRAAESGQITPEDAAKAIDENWAQYQQAITQWSAGSSDKQKVARQSIQNLSPLVTQIRTDALAPVAQRGF